MRRLALVAALVVVVGACSSEPDVPDQPGVGKVTDAKWTKAEAMPTPRTEVGAAAIGRRLFVAGGFTRDGKASGVVEIFDQDNNRWKKSRRLVEPLHHLGVVALRGRLYVIGGYRANGTASAAVYSQRVSATGKIGPWRREKRMPTARGALAAAVVSGKIHVLGGASAFRGRPQLVGAHEVYDPTTKKWAALPDLPDPRDHLAAAGGNGRVYVAGGRKLSTSTNSARFDIFDIAANRWVRGPDMPTARGGIAGAAVARLFIVFGGEDPQRTHSEAEVYETVADRWAAAPPMPTSRHGLGAAVIGDRVYVVGGGPQPGLSVSGSNEALDVGG